MVWSEGSILNALARSEVYKGLHFNTKIVVAKSVHPFHREGVCSLCDKPNHGLMVLLAQFNCTTCSDVRDTQNEICNIPQGTYIYRYILLCTYTSPFWWSVSLFKLMFARYILVNDYFTEIKLDFSKRIFHTFLCQKMAVFHMTNLVGIPATRWQTSSFEFDRVFEQYYNTWYAFLSDCEKSLQKRSFNSFNFSFKNSTNPHGTWPS